MKKKLSTWLVKIAMKMNPLAHENCVPQFKEYEASAIGAAWAVTDDDILKYKRKHRIKGKGKARRCLINEKVLAQHNAILNKADTLIFSQVYEKDGQTVIESRLNVYVPKEAKKQFESRTAKSN